MTVDGAAGHRWRNLGATAGAVAAVLFALFDLYQWALAYAADRFHNDFTFYFAAARIGASHGWSSIYDLRLQQIELDAMGSGITIAQLARYISPPPVAWMALPFTALPFPVAYWIWCAVLLLALAVTWHLAAPGEGRLRLIHLAAAIGWLPVIYGLQLGQPGLLVALGVAASYALLRRGHQGWAGVALAPLVLKPQLAFLVPLALLAARRDRAFIAGAVTLGLLGAASAIALGSGGIATYQARLNFAAGVVANRELTIAPLLGNLAVARGVQVAVAVWALALVYLLRRRDPEWTLVPALVGGLLASPYLHLDDFAMLGLAAWLCIRTPVASWTWAFALAVVMAVEAEPFWGPLPIIVLELASLVLMSVLAFRVTERDRAQPVLSAPSP
ncbi:MAG TPA: glycosyltransferase family 87 protein [Candidatus Dormibacteraeota bacterium]|jgi:hypothetical protein